MNNNIDNLFRLLVPAIFLVLWALHQLFNKENAPPPTNRPGGGLGPRPGGPPRPATDYGREVPYRDPTGPVPGPTRAASSAPEDEIVIIRSETARPAGVGGGPPRDARRPPRPRPSRPGRGSREPRREAPEPRPGPEAPVPATPPPPTTGGPASPILIGLAPPLSADELRRALTSPSRIREAILVNEILQPPKALRGRRGPGR